VSAWVVQCTLHLQLLHERLNPNESTYWDTSRQVPQFVIDTDLSGIDSGLEPDALIEQVERAARNVVVTMHAPPTRIVDVTVSVAPYEGARS
jgi:hypothetical protein